MRTWKCPVCGHATEISYDWLAQNGGPVCGQCDCDMELVPVPQAGDEAVAHPARDNTELPVNGQSLRDLLAKAEEAGMNASDLDGLVHELAGSVAADLNNSGMEDQLRYLVKEMGSEAVKKELDRLARTKAGPDRDDEDDKPEDVSCANCGRTDLPLHTNGQCAECGPNGENAPRIAAECHSDDRLYSAGFNAVPWFQRAKDSDILDLAAVDWGDEYAADEIGMFMATFVPDVERMFDYIERYNQAHKEHIGWVCTVNKDDVLQWLESHRPQLHQQVLAIEQRISG